jgi:polyisoprenoid-binding protein YceI
MKHCIWYCLIQLTGIIVMAQQVVQQPPQQVVQQPAQQVVARYTPEDQGSSVTFTIKNLGFKVNGTFTGLQGIIGFDPKHLSGAAFDVSVDAATVNTDNSMRDDHLKGAGYFDVQHYPRIRFVSTSVSARGMSGRYIISGKLTIRDTTKEITFPFTATPKGDDYIFSGEFNINRKDFKIGGSGTISNSLTVSLSIFAGNDKK